LRTVWQRLDELQRAAVDEVVHAGSTEFEADCFQAKYGRGPNWGTTDKYVPLDWLWISIWQDVRGTSTSEPVPSEYEGWWRILETSERGDGVGVGRLHGFSAER
jgi:hypothetical protein